MSASYSRDELTLEQNVICAYMHFIRGISQGDLATLFDIHPNRVGEACVAAKIAAERPVRALALWKHAEAREAHEKDRQQARQAQAPKRQRLGESRARLTKLRKEK